MSSPKEKKDNKTQKDIIPYPSYYSWMHSRVNIPIWTLEQKFERWKKQPTSAIALDAVLSRLVKLTPLDRGNNRWVFYKLLSRSFKALFKIFNQFKVNGLDKIPKSGCIFYVNHPGTLDPIVLGAALPFHVSMFIAWGNGWFMDFLEERLGFLPSRGYDNRSIKVEKYIRQIIKKNRYFAIWPSGHPTESNLVEQGYSSIIRAYSVLNSKKDIIPFVPVLIKGAEIYTYPPYPRPGPIEVNFYDPIYFPRDWLKEPKNGGKSPRELIDFLMCHLAQKNGQKELKTNPLLERKRAYYKKKNGCKN